MKFEGLTTHTNMLLGTKEEALEQEVNVRRLKQCYREAREEIDELRVLMKEQNDQLQDYRVKVCNVLNLIKLILHVVLTVPLKSMTSKRLILIMHAACKQSNLI